MARDAVADVLNAVRADLRRLTSSSADAIRGVRRRYVMRWAASADRWRRRLVLVATVPLNSRARGGQGDTARTLRVGAALVDDRDDMVVKALSWALRELSKREPKSVETGRMVVRAT